MSTLDALPQTFLERGITPPLLDVLRDGRAYHLRDGLIVNRGDGFEGFRLLGGEPNCHCLGGLHGDIVPPIRSGGQQPWYRGVVVSRTREYLCSTEIPITRWMSEAIQWSSTSRLTARTTRSTSLR